MEKKEKDFVYFYFGQANFYRYPTEQSNGSESSEDDSSGIKNAFTLFSDSNARLDDDDIAAKDVGIDEDSLTDDNPYADIIRTLKDMANEFVIFPEVKFIMDVYHIYDHVVSNVGKKYDNALFLMPSFSISTTPKKRQTFQIDFFFYHDDEDNSDTPFWEFAKNIIGSYDSEHGEFKVGYIERVVTTKGIAESVIKEWKSHILEGNVLFRDGFTDDISGHSNGMGIIDFPDDTPDDFPDGFYDFEDDIEGDGYGGYIEKDSEGDDECAGCDSVEDDDDDTDGNTDNNGFTIL